MKSDRPRGRTIRVDHLARVEGEGGLYIKVKGSQVLEVKLNIFEPPRFFEAFLRGRDFREAPDITARICGICPVAYQMSAVHALENALGVQVGGALRNLRRLLYCGEWIESHALHVTLLHAPDFLGYPDGIRMAREHPQAVRRGLGLKKAGNEIVTVLGGREIHPINVRVGGFYRVPSRQELQPLEEKLKRARDAALEMVRWTAKLNFPELEQSYEFVTLRHPTEYPLNEGRIVSSSGLDISAAEYEDHFAEEQAPHSNALHSTLRGRAAYLVGPLARYNLNFERLSPLAREAARAAGLGPTCRNPFQSIVVRSVEILYACDEALRLISEYEPPERAFVEVEPRPSSGAACTEAPRGLLYHRYRIAADGSIVEAKIVPPTSQNQKTIEGDLLSFVESHLGLAKDELQASCEQVVRNYDPCISCATHFLTLELEKD
ncbi:MAG TPA: Ni/Fe hydrogenase subunit alpha [Candidatus Acidoferrales bacterium]|nr:Ni/Fe hydrogenase subunit alpha [Candidatus Acidoferrales bacterium]